MNAPKYWGRSYFGEALIQKTMNDNAQKIIEALTLYLEQNPSIRFSQALFNLGINEFADKEHPELKSFLLRDIYNDNDGEILKRIETKIKSK